MLNKKIHDAMNDQIQRELESAYIYLSMAAYFDSINLPGFAQWMKAQFQEEQAHAFKFYDFVYDRGVQVILQALGQPPVEFQSPLNVFEKTLEQAYFHLETIDSYCRILLLIKPLGQIKYLDDAQVRELLEIKRQMGIDDPRLD